MEHRKSKRRPTTLYVEAHYDNRGQDQFYFCLTHDVGLGGMFLSAKGLQLPKQAKMRLVFASQTHEGTWHSIPAEVVRQSNDGLGVKFDEVDSEAMQSLRKVVL